ncbi:MAG TPA: ThuA domain-containing protein [Bacteroidales bacterium]|nr:ThuA domain-containing protein [Bacteroidales bacterium]
MKKQILFIILAVIASAFVSCKKDTTVPALIVTGQNNSHDWQASSPVLKQILDNSGIFRTEIIMTPGKGEDMSSFLPNFSKYKLILIDYEGDPWPEKTNNAFVDFVKNGGGVVIYHSSSISFPEWKEYNEIAGVGGWGGRNEKSGPYVYYRNNKLVTDTAAGEAGYHGERREFVVRTRISDHPVTKGLPARWIHGNDELYSLLRGPAKNMEILATAFSDTVGGGTMRDEPVLMTIRYGNGRIFHTALGHSEKDGGPAMHCAGFIVTLQRGAEWAATGEVTQKVPFDFPSAAGVVMRNNYKELSLEEALNNLVSYDAGKSTRSLTCLQHHIRNNAGNSQELLKVEQMMTKVLTNADASIESKKLILRELSWMGSDYSVETLKSLAADEMLKDEALFALERMGK